RLREQRLEGIINTVADGIITVDDHGVIQTFNPAAEGIFGFRKEEVIGKNVRTLVQDEVLTAPSDEPGWVRTLAASSEIVGRRKDGEVVPLELSMREMQQGDELSFTSIVRDISERKAAEQRVFRMAHHDALTELPNRNLFGDRVVEAFKRAKRHTEKLALLFVDLDKFKPINDTYGHAVGDEVLKAAANRLRFGVRATDTVARVGGDEFMVLLEELADAEEAEEIRQKLQTELCQPMRLSHHKVAIGASIGIAVYPDNGSEIAELMDYADQDMYARKHARGAEPTPRT
ncbi:MAG TPA: diguanylate cyclase, partial [Rhodospirillaceae bacterium]|nr:diguanylate cyclase [Rhodospirillaceae bacterium]